MSVTSPSKIIFWTAAVLAAVGLVLWLGSVARHGTPTWPVADGALIELYTMHATAGDQLLGVYSQYGWFHPGPLLFYVLAPFYALGGRTVYGLDLGALFINLISIVTVAAIVARRKDITPATSILLFAGVFIYAARLREMLTSAWNPHVSVLPFAALIVCAASVLSGDVAVLPLLVVFASFVTQTHVGFVPAAGALTAIAIAGIGYRAIVDRSSRATMSLWLLISVFILQLIWLPTVAEQLARHPGNLTRIWQFFGETAQTQTAGATLRAWSSMLMGVVRPDFAVAIGIGFPGSSPGWTAAALLCVAVLALSGVSSWRRGNLFEGALVAACLLASGVGFWSVLHIRGLIGDYQLFWLSVLGVFDLALALGFLMSLVQPLRLPVWLTFRTVSLSAILTVVATALLGSGHLRLATRSTALPDESQIVRQLTEQMRETLPSTGGRTAVLRFDSTLWGMGAGIMLQMARASIPFTVDDDLATRFDPNLAETGDEDVLITFGGPEVHRELASRPGNVTLAMSDGAQGRYYLDAISLVDHPEYRIR